MTRYLLDGRSLQHASSVRGIGTYARGLLEGFASAGVAGDIELLLSRGREIPRELSALGIHPASPRLPVTSRRLQPLADPLLVGRAVRRIRPGLYHGLEYGQPLRPGVPVVITVHDLIPFVLPHLYPWMRRERLLALRLLRSADAVLADSHSTRRDLVTIARVPSERITVVLPGVGDRFQPVSEADATAVLERQRVRRPYVLAVGTFDPRKRIGLLTAVMGRLRSEHDVELVIAGDQGAYQPRVVATVEQEGLAPHTRLLGHVTHDELLALYTGAACLAFTSAYEGFGLPLLEAMACGTPVVAFDNSSLPEVGGTAAILLPDGDGAAMATAIARLLADDGERRHRRHTGMEWAAGFSWRRTAQDTLAVYRSLTV